MRKQNRRSYKRQGIEQIPTVHMGVAAVGICAVKFAVVFYNGSGYTKKKETFFT